MENVADDVAKSDKNAAESRPEEGALLQKRGAGEEQDGDGAQHTWGWWTLAITLPRWQGQSQKFRKLSGQQVLRAKTFRTREKCVN